MNENVSDDRSWKINGGRKRMVVCWVKKSNRLTTYMSVDTHVSTQTSKRYRNRLQQSLSSTLNWLFSRCLLRASLRRRTIKSC